MKAFLFCNRIILSFVFLIAGNSSGFAQPAQQSMTDVADQIQPRLVKIFGAGGMQRLESWQTGMFISPDGLILTSYSYVLDQTTTIVLHDGQRTTAKLVGFDPDTEIALLKAEVQQQPCFPLANSDSSSIGQRILAFSNLYGIATGNEPCSLQIGIISSIQKLNAKRGNRQIAYQGPALILDAITNNPGATGGAITNRDGQLLAMIGRESKDARTGQWLNYAIPQSVLFTAVQRIEGKQPRTEMQTAKPSEPVTLDLLGIRLVPKVVERTPPFIDEVVKGGAADRAGLIADDLIVELNSQVVTSVDDLKSRFLEIDRDSSFQMTIRRAGKFMQVTLRGNQP